MESAHPFADLERATRERLAVLQEEHRALQQRNPRSDPEFSAHHIHRENLQMLIEEIRGLRAIYRSYLP
jgi:hypothetical protein